MIHNHLSWIQEGQNCPTCNVYFRDLIFETSRKLVELQEKLALMKFVCQKCFTASYAPCDPSHIAAKRINGKYVFCQFCWLSKSL